MTNMKREMMVALVLALSTAGTSAAGMPIAPGLQGGNVRTLVGSAGSLNYAEMCPGPTPSGNAHCHLLLHSDPHGLATPAPAPASFGALDLVSAYAIPFPVKGAPYPTVAVVSAYDNPNAEQDLGVYRNNWNQLSQWPMRPCTSANGCFQKVNQNGASSPLPTANANWGAETDTEIELVSVGCPYCRILLVEANSTSLSDLAAAENTAVGLGANFIANGWGSPEFSGEIAFEATFNHPGVGIFASAGSSGYGVEYPAASTYVTAVGGTLLSSGGSSTRSWTETAWPYTGSGCSQYIAKPFWQQDAGCANRTTNDVAAVAQGVSVYDSYGQPGWYTAAGTDIGSALVAGIYAATGSLGAASGLSYQHRTAFYDVISGSNGSCSPPYLCNAGWGYDGPTGNGTPNGGAIQTWSGEDLFGSAGQHLAVETNSNGELQLTYPGFMTDSVDYLLQGTPGGSWSAQQTIGGNALQLSVSRNFDGRLEAFYVGPDSVVYHNWQTPGSSSWYGEIPLYAWSGRDAYAKQITAARNNDGRLEVFYVGTDDAIYHNWQTTPGGGWWGEVRLGGYAKQIISTRHIDGTLAIYYVGTDNNLYSNAQVFPQGGWSGEVPVPGGPASQIAVGHDQVGTPWLVYVDTSYGLHSQFYSGGVWSTVLVPAPAGPVARQVEIGKNLDGTLAMFYVGTDTYLHYFQWENPGGWNGPFSPVGPTGNELISGTELQVGRNFDGRLEIFYNSGVNGALYTTSQMAPGAAGTGTYYRWSPQVALAGWAL